MTIQFKLKSLCFALVSAMVISVSPAMAATAPEAAQLGKTLTPLGGEKAGNADGSIPAWDGGYTKVDPAYRQGGKRLDPFSAEKPLFSITAKNLAQYADKLNDGTKAMFAKYPETYRVDVYPTHRTAAAPQWVYDNSARNAVNAKLIDSSAGVIPDGAYGGIPFPIPKTGEEAMWNHLLSWRGTSVSMHFRHHLMTADGVQVMTTDGKAIQEMPYYYPEGSAETFDGFYWMFRLLNIGPPIRTGEQVLGRANLNGDKSQSHVYLAGQRRVRKLPNACCDTPTPATAGVMSFDELSVYSGRLDIFNWKLVGKQEMYVPYNGNKVQTAAKPEDLFAKHHMNPDYVRWELHRVWVVEANLAPGKRHQLPKGRYYLDEDSWQALLGDRWDASGQLAKTLWALPAVMPDIPAHATLSSGFYDLTSGAWFIQNVYSGLPEQYGIVDRYKGSEFSPAAMAGQGVR
ncbi:DUF1329 domain-containing protein [Pseudomonas sp. PCH199]|uniref:DUF1329 domain-containing protein n=1 Tax=unclassified Pseudomonas TaxID=196821 RepID=UPI000BCCA383|nr:MULTISPECIES: DUF1329 domain-containing protein [unclassified Pseudomonas]MCW8277863.1 DUF1329 domain-containing protein [Pseudomonas sp. PCH199]PAM82022.1 hypothetical protein CES87_22060 [Pseudomonas sp. ERMR1:02]